MLHLVFHPDAFTLTQLQDSCFIWSRLLFSLVSQLLALSVGCDILEPSAILCVYILACLDAQQLHAGEIWVLEGDWVHLVAIFTCSPPGLSHVWSL